MEKQNYDRCAHVGMQVDKLREIYSQIGEPLPVDVMIDLYRHLPDALELCRTEKTPGKRFKMKNKALH